MFLQRAVFRVLPHHFLSRLGGWAARRRAGPLTTAAVHWFVGHYRVDLAEAAESSPRAYATFNAFFTRALRTGARPQPGDPAALASPVDAAVSAAGPIHGGSLIQAKGLDYPLAELIAADAEPFEGGTFASFYLRPSDYHRVHVPLAGSLTAIRHCRGRLWPVRPWAVRALPRLFCGNERLVLDFECVRGRYALVMVGAFMVGGLETVVTGPVRRRRRDPARWNLQAAPRQFERGEEVGRFNFGSAVILLCEPGLATLDGAVVAPGREIRLGQTLGRVKG